MRRRDGGGPEPANGVPDEDPVDQVLAQWRRVRPDLDVRVMGYVGRLGRFARLAERKIEAGLAAFGLTIADFDVLAALRRAGAPHQATPTQLYRGLMITSGTMTNRIDRLADRGLVTRLEDPNDRRGTIVALTAEGRKLVDEAVEAHLDNERALLAPLTRAEQAALDGLVRKLVAPLEAAPAAPEEAAPADAGPAARRRGGPRGRAR